MCRMRKLVFFGSLFLAWMLISCSEEKGGLKVSGRVEMDTVRVGTKIGGRIEKIHVEEGDSLKAGEVVIELERKELDAQLGQARAAQKQAQAQLDLLLAGTRKEDIRRAEAAVEACKAELQLRRKGFRDEEIREAEAQLASARSTLELVRLDWQRAETLFESGTIQQAELDARRAAHETARSAVEMALQRRQLLQSGSRPEEIAMTQARLDQAEAELERLRNGPRIEEITAQRAILEASQAGVRYLETQLEETSVRAPIECVVETFDLKPGDLVKPGESVAVLNLPSTPWIRCYVPENRLGEVRPGMKVGVTVDSFPGEVFPGIVRRIHSEAEFTPRNVQTTEKRSELVFEMKVDVPEKGERLRAGMFADVHISSADPGNR